jgi:Mrp family chromosome partitioning ATPase
VPEKWKLTPSLAAPAAAELGTLSGRLVGLERKGCSVVGVTSREPALRGKSFVAARLAVHLASSGKWRVLLMETSFDYPAVHTTLDVGVAPGAGFSQQLRARNRTGEVLPWAVVQCTRTLHALPEGVVRSPGILQTRLFPQAVQELRRAYDFIVIDGPALGSGGDHQALDEVMDALVLAVGPGESLEQGLDEASGSFANKDLIAAVPSVLPD